MTNPSKDHQVKVPPEMRLLLVHLRKDGEKLQFLNRTQPPTEKTSKTIVML